jgi:hypothetical protein
MKDTLSGAPARNGARWKAAPNAQGLAPPSRPKVTVCARETAIVSVDTPRLSQPAAWQPAPAPSQPVWRHEPLVRSLQGTE